MLIPQSFNNTVISIFGERGSQWLEKLPSLLDDCISKWSLSDIMVSQNLSINLICFAKSPEFGDVALKIGVPHTDLFTEMKALEIYGGKNICKCHDYDIALGAMILERISPGTQLLAVENQSLRISIAADLISILPIAIEECHDLPSYADWVYAAFARAKAENKVGPLMLRHTDTAMGFFNELESLGRPRVLLHGDLHHENILLGADNIWRAIDPKGIIGIPCMECARFMENQIGMVDFPQRLDCLDEMAAVFAEKFAESKLTISKCVFVLKVLSICWTFEDYVLPENMDAQIETCQFLLDYIDKMIRKNQVNT